MLSYIKKTALKNHATVHNQWQELHNVLKKLIGTQKREGVVFIVTLFKHLAPPLALWLGWAKDGGKVFLSCNTFLQRRWLGESIGRSFYSSMCMCDLPRHIGTKMDGQDHCSRLHWIHKQRGSPLPPILPNFYPCCCRCFIFLFLKLLRAKPHRSKKRSKCVPFHGQQQKTGSGCLKVHTGFLGDEWTHTSCFASARLCDKQFWRKQSKQQEG